jgi:dUTP pyrophosphatase
MKVKIKKLHPNAEIPEYAHSTDAGLDLTAITMHYNDLENVVEYDTGLSFEIPEGFVGLVFPRSSICKKTLALTNAVGVIDSGYRGSIKFKFKDTTKWVSDKQSHYKVGDKIGQIIIIPYPKVELEEVTELENSERGTGGFGSTDV